jgi:hypothetical protein
MVSADTWRSGWGLELVPRRSIDRSVRGGVVKSAPLGSSRVVSCRRRIARISPRSDRRTEPSPGHSPIRRERLSASRPAESGGIRIARSGPAGFADEDLQAVPLGGDPRSRHSRSRSATSSGTSIASTWPRLHIDDQRVRPLAVDELVVDLLALERHPLDDPRLLEQLERPVDRRLADAEPVSPHRSSSASASNSPSRLMIVSRMCARSGCTCAPPSCRCWRKTAHRGGRISASSGMGIGSSCITRDHTRPPAPPRDPGPDHPRSEAP